VKPKAARIYHVGRRCEFEPLRDSKFINHIHDEEQKQCT